MHPRAYEAISEDQLEDIPDHTHVIHAFALDTAKHLSVNGRYPGFLALPDRWISWWMAGVVRGLLAIRRKRPLVIWSTYPIATAHLIGLTLHKLTGIPWVADFRDSMTEDYYPKEARRRKVFLWIEQKTVENCSRAVFTTPGAIRMYSARYPHIAAQKWVLIPNGYNEEIFLDAESNMEIRIPDSTPSNIVLVHSGVVYPSERDPGPFFQALANLKTEKAISSEGLSVIMRATGHDEYFQPMIDQLDINDIVQLAPGLPYRAALQEMLRADGLLILQAANCNHQIPAKLYEYFRARRPILALTDCEGDTATTMLDAGIDSVAPLDNTHDISFRLRDFLQKISRGDAPIASAQATLGASREHGAKRLANEFERLLSSV